MLVVLQFAALLIQDPKLQLFLPQALKQIDPHNYVCRRKTFSILRGVSGQPINTLSEVTLVFCLNSDLEMHHTVTVCDVRFLAPEEEEEAPSAPDDPWVAILNLCA